MIRLTGTLLMSKSHHPLHMHRPIALMIRNKNRSYSVMPSVVEFISQNYPLSSLALTVTMQLSFYAIAVTKQTDKVTDFAGTLNFAVLAVGIPLCQQTFFTRQCIDSFLVLVWSTRLGSFLVQRVMARGKDERFDAMRAKPLAFLGFFVGQMAWVWLVSLPLTLLNASTINVPIQTQDYVGWTLWFIGFGYQVLADRTKARFVADGLSKTQVLNKGVWAHCRAPNYFGEIAMWTGLTLSATSALSGFSAAAAWLSPLFTFCTLVYATGIPLTEKRNQQRFGNRPDYLQYKQQTSPLWPCPPSVYRNLSPWLKRNIFLDRM